MEFLQRGDKRLYVTKGTLQTTVRVKTRNNVLYRKKDKNENSKREVVTETRQILQDVKKGERKTTRTKIKDSVKIYGRL